MVSSLPQHGMHKICSSEGTSGERVNHRSVGSLDLAVSSDVREDVSVSVEDQSQLAEVGVLRWRGEGRTEGK